MTTALEGDGGSASRPGRSLPPGKTRYPLYRRLGGPQGRSGQVRKISPPPPPGIRSPDRPACSQSLYRLSYRCHTGWIETTANDIAVRVTGAEIGNPKLRFFLVCGTWLLVANLLCSDKHCIESVLYVIKIYVFKISKFIFISVLFYFRYSPHLDSELLVVFSFFTNTTEIHIRY